MQMDFVYQIDNLRLNIELNLRPKITKNRNIGYVIKSYAENIKKTLPSYNNDYKTIQININSENIFDNKEIIEEVYLRNKEGDLYSDKIGIYLVNVANLKKTWYTDGELFDEKYNCLTSLFVRRKDSIEKILEKEGIKNIMERMEEFSSDQEEWVSYRDENEIENTYKYGLEMAREEGIEEGIRKTALKMLEENLDMDMISKITKLSIEEINELKSDL